MLPLEIKKCVKVSSAKRQKENFTVTSGEQGTLTKSCYINSAINNVRCNG